MSFTEHESEQLFWKVIYSLIDDGSEDNIEWEFVAALVGNGKTASQCRDQWNKIRRQKKFQEMIPENMREILE